MSAESGLGDLLEKLDTLAAVPMRESDADELALVSRVAGGEVSTHGLAGRVREGETSWREVWADPLSQGQAGLDLLGAVMRHTGAEAVAHP